MTAKKSEPVRSLRSRSITRTGNESISSPKATSTPASRSPGRTRPAARTASPGRKLRTRSPARSGAKSSGTSPSGTRKKSSSSGTSPRQSRTAPSSVKKSSPARPVTPTRSSTRQQAVKSHLTARIMPVSTSTAGGAAPYPSHVDDLPPTPTEDDYRTDRKLQKIVDEYLTSGTTHGQSGSKKRLQGKNWASGLMTMMKKGVEVVGCVAGWVLTCTLALVFIAGPFLMSLVCDLKSCSLTSRPALPLNLTTYFDVEAAGAVTVYLLTTALLSALPLSRLTTIVTSSGLKHNHHTNGFAGLVLTGAVLGAAYVYKLPVFTFISGRFLALVITLYVYAVLLVVWMYVRGRGAPASSISPFTKSGNIVTHILSGLETNPKLLGLIDVKSFLLCHISCLSWIIMDTVVVVEAYQRDHLNSSIILVAACHAFYLIDFILFEKSLGTTMLMSVDGVGLRLITQCLLFTPIVHTAVLRYLLQQAQSPGSAQWSWLSLTVIAITFLVGYAIHRVSSYQKHLYRTMPHHPTFSKLEMIPTNSGRSLLCGGTLWKFCRHPNHLGVIIMSIAFSVPAGFTCPLTYVYPLVIILGLLVRERRMEKLCEARHGKGWTRYVQAVRSKLIPYIY